MPVRSASNERPTRFRCAPILRTVNGAGLIGADTEPSRPNRDHDRPIPRMWSSAIAVL